MRHLKVAISFTLAIFALSVNTASAALVGGSVTIIEPPLNTGNNNQQINELLGFDERQHVLLTNDLMIDEPSGFLPAGTIVSSHYIIYDPPSGVQSIVGTAVFDANVIGLIYNTGSLNNSDFLGLPTTNYLNPTNRGFEGYQNDDADIIDPNTVEFDLAAGSPGDYARIITVSDSANPGPQFIMRSPRVASGGVHTNETGIGSVRLLFDEPLVFDSDDVTVEDENSQSVTAYSTGSGSEFMVITFDEPLFANTYTITVHDTALGAISSNAIDGDNNGTAGGDYVFTMEHRQRHDSDNDDDIDLFDLSELASLWLWSD